jgi:hypothetical protein
VRPVSVGTVLTANTKTTVYTVPTGYYALWNLCYISNHTGNNKNVSVWWYDSSANTEVTIIDSYSLDARKFLQFGGGGAYVVLEEGDQIRIISETGSTMAATNTFDLYGAQRT